MKNGASAVLWAAALGAAGVVWFCTGAGAALGAALALLLAPGLSLLGALPVRKKLTAGLVFKPSGPKRSAVLLGVTLRSDARFFPARVGLTLRVTNDLTGETLCRRVSLSVGPRSEARAELLLQAEHCGRVHVTAERVRLYDLFGVFSLPAAVRAEAGFASMPVTFAPLLRGFEAAATPEDGGEYAPDRRGADASETFRLRDYAPGDSLRQIHWKLSGKLDKLIVREGSLPLSRSLLVFWDRSAARTDPAAADAMAEVTVSLCQALSESGLPYVLGWDDDAGCPLTAVESTDGLFAALPRLLRSAGTDGRSGAARFLAQYGPADFGRVVYIAAGVPAVLSDFLGGAEALGLLCVADAGAFPGRAVAFGAAGYAKALETLEFSV